MFDKMYIWLFRFFSVNQKRCSIDKILFNLNELHFTKSEPNLLHDLKIHIITNFAKVDIGKINLVN